MNTFDDSVSRLGPATSEPSVLDVGVEPARIAAIGERVLVTVRGEGAIAELHDGAAPALVRKVPVGSEPIGIVTNPDQTRGYVALSAEDRVVELDGCTLEPRREWPVADQPAWLAIHPSGGALYVASAMAGRLAWIDLISANAQAVRIAIPPVRHTSGAEDAIRLTGDLAVRRDGTEFVVPVLYVDTTRPLSDGCRVSSIEDERQLRPSIGRVPLDSSGAPGEVQVVGAYLVGWDWNEGALSPSKRGYGPQPSSRLDSFAVAQGAHLPLRRRILRGHDRRSLRPLRSPRADRRRTLRHRLLHRRPAGLRVVRRRPGQ